MHFDGVFVRYARLISSLAVFGAIAGVAVGVVLPIRWEAVALIQVGQVGQIGTAESPGQSMPVETPARALERLKSAGFAAKRMEEMFEREGALADVGSIRASVRVTIPRGTELLELRLSARSAELARAAATAMIAELISTHGTLASPKIARLQAELKLVDSALEATERERAELVRLNKSEAALGQGGRFSERVLLSSLISGQDQKLGALRERRLQVEEQISPANTYPTAVFGEVHVALKRFNYALLGVLGFAVGALCGVVIATFLSMRSGLPRDA